MLVTNEMINVSSTITFFQNPRYSDEWKKIAASENQINLCAC